MELIKRKARTIPFGYKLADNINYIEPIPEELEALEQAIKYLQNSSYREVANWLYRKTNRKLSHVGLKKYTKNGKNRTTKAKSKCW